MMKRALACALLFATAIAGSSAWAGHSFLMMRAPCHPYQMVVDKLTADGQTIRKMMVSATKGDLVEFWADDKDEWTLILHKTNPDDIGCLTDYGTGWADAAMIQEKGL